MAETTLSEGAAVSLRLPAEAVAKLREEAEQHGQTLESYLQQLLLGRTDPERNGKRTSAAGALALPPDATATEEEESLEDTFDYKPVVFPIVGTMKVRFIDGGPLAPGHYPEDE